MKLKVSEIFYSLQGEGARKGTPTIFIRLTGCKAKHACFKLGIRCDTEFESGREYDIEELLDIIREIGGTCGEITWTGGEPLDQLTSEHIAFFKEKGYYQAVETSGLHPILDGFDFVCVSPKVAEHVIAKNMKHVSELRYVRHSGQDIPRPNITADYYWLSPHSDGMTINEQNVKHCIALCLQYPQWKLSIQDHKLWNIL